MSWTSGTSGKSVRYEIPEYFGEFEGESSICVDAWAGAGAAAVPMSCQRFLDMTNLNEVIFHCSLQAVRMEQAQPTRREENRGGEENTVGFEPHLTASADVWEEDEVPNQLRRR